MVVNTTLCGYEQLHLSPDIAPSDYHLFLHLKKNLGNKHYNDNVKIVVMHWLAHQASDSIKMGYKRWLYDIIGALI